MTWDPSDKEKTALHEAGHAVVAWSLDAPVKGVYLDLENESGHTDADSADLEPVKQIAIWLAGFEAERIFKPPAKPRRALGDRYRVRKILEGNKTPEDTSEGQELREQRRACAEALLRQHEARVRRVAHHLMEHHSIDRVAFEAMMQ
jgi:hypothetical protein